MDVNLPDPQASFAVVDPSSGMCVGQAPAQGETEARLAIDFAEQAFNLWRKIEPAERAATLKRFATHLEGEAERLARVISLEQGKPLRESRAEIGQGIAYLHWFAEEARRGYGDLVPDRPGGGRMLIRREPVGIVAAVTPWNFPFSMPLRKIAPALAAGCPVLLKPAPETPLSALAIAVVAREAGLADGLLTVVTGTREASAGIVGAWLADPRVRKLSFTGSSATGRRLAELASVDLKRLSLELGGNAPFLIFEDADLDHALEGLLSAKFRNAGQTCISPNRVLVQTGIYDRFVTRLAERVGRLVAGPADDPASDIGPLISDAAVAKIDEQLADAVARGARLLCGGHARERFYQPTLLADVTPDMLIAQEETFGPVVALQQFAGEADAIRAANDSCFGLAAYAFTTDADRIWRLGESLEAGMVGVNQVAISTEVGPFGGIKQSGYGREGSRYGLDDYQNLKLISLGPASSAHVEEMKSC